MSDSLSPSAVLCEYIYECHLLFLSHSPQSQPTITVRPIANH